MRLELLMSGDDGRDNAHSVTTREVSWTAGSFFSVLPSVQFVGLILPSKTHAEIRTRLHASAISSDIRRLGCVTSALFEWPVWSSSSGNNCHVVHWSLSSVHHWSGTFTLSHIISRAHLRDFFRLLAIGMCHFLPVHHLGIAFLCAGSKVKT